MFIFIELIKKNRAIKALFIYKICYNINGSLEKVKVRQ